jgi:hypothetical protein
LSWSGHVSPGNREVCTLSQNCGHLLLLNFFPTTLFLLLVQPFSSTPSALKLSPSLASSNFRCRPLICLHRIASLIALSHLPCRHAYLHSLPREETAQADPGEKDLPNHTNTRGVGWTASSQNPGPTPTDQRQREPPLASSVVSSGWLASLQIDGCESCLSSLYGGEIYSIFLVTSGF